MKNKGLLFRMLRVDGASRHFDALAFEVALNAPPLGVNYGFQARGDERSCSGEPSRHGRDALLQSSG